jgi:uncharacterized protein YndB with AHSA1/START domain
MTAALPDDEPLVRKTALVTAPVAEVWWAWTTDAGLRAWLLHDARVELRVGGAYEWYFLDDAAPGSRGSEGCQVVGYQAPTMLTFTWNAPPHLPHARAQRTVVLLRLHPVEQDVPAGARGGPTRVRDAAERGAAVSPGHRGQAVGTAGAATRVELTHLGWGSGGQWDEAREYFDAAWGRVLGRLEDFFARADDRPGA